MKIEKDLNLGLKMDYHVYCLFALDVTVTQSEKCPFLLSNQFLISQYWKKLHLVSHHLNNKNNITYSYFYNYNFIAITCKYKTI